MDISGLFFIGSFLFAKDETVVEEEVEDHDNYRIKCKSTGSKDELIGEGKMDGTSDIVGKFVKWS